MPDPLLYFQAMGAAAIVSAIFVLAMLAARSAVSTTWLNSTCVVAVGLGLVAGYFVLSFSLAWPPTNALERLLTIVVPAAIGIELIAGLERVPRGVAWLLRIGLAAGVPRILLHGSMYLSGSGDWTLWQAGMSIAVCSVLLASLWSLIVWLSRRSGGVSISLALCLSIQCAGVTVMMAGYIKGGAAALPLVASLAATSLAATALSKRLDMPAGFAAAGVLGLGVVSLFGILFIGRFFGEISTGAALTMLLSPLLCWVTEIPRLRNRNPWLVGSLRIALVAIPLVVVLAAAKRDFDRDMSPLLSKAKTFPSQVHREESARREKKSLRESPATYCPLPALTRPPGIGRFRLDRDK